MKEEAKIEQYIDLIKSWNKTHNLVSSSQINKLDEHVQDSLSIFKHTSQTLLDLGSGGGFPGIPIAIKGPEKKIFLIESNTKKASFLLNTTNKLNLKNISVINGRIEDLDPKEFPKDFEIIARAIGTTKNIIKITKKYLDLPGTKLKLMKTEEQFLKEQLPEDYTVKKIHKIPSKGKDKGRILVTIEKDG